MPPRLTTNPLTRSHTSPLSSPSIENRSQIRHASLLRRPHRPYTFTQLITLSDGSTYMSRTTSPAPIFRSTKDTRNHPLWQPSLGALRNVEQDEAGKLRAFRNKFGRGWDLDGEGEDGEEEGVVKGKAKEGGERRDTDAAGGSLMELISDANAARGEQNKLGSKSKGGKN